MNDQIVQQEGMKVRRSVSQIENRAANSTKYPELLECLLEHMIETAVGTLIHSGVLSVMR